MAIRIGLGHRARHGKDSVGAFMKNKLGEQVQLFSFARKLKEYCRDHHEELLIKWQLAHQTKQVPTCKEDPIYGYTAILQWYGTDIVRKSDPDYWVRSIEADIAALPEHSIAVITDVRFPNEAEWVKQNGYLCRVVRLHEDGSMFEDPTRAPHISETALDEYGKWNFHILAKSGDMDGLKFAASELLREVSFAQRVGWYVPDNVILATHAD